MKIVVDQEGKQVLQQLCDIALRAGGLQNLQPINALLNLMQVENPAPAVPPTPSTSPIPPKTTAKNDKPEEEK